MIKSRMLNYFFKKKRSDSVVIQKDVIKRYLPPCPLIIDCGAHIGLDTIELSSIEGSRIFAFEPIVQLFERLVENTQPCRNIECFNVALSDYNGVAEMYVSSGGSDGSSSLLKPKEHLVDHPDVLFKQITKVKSMTLDSWAKENQIQKIDMLWLDMQGAEQKMLMASKDIFKTVTVIHSEISTKETYENVKTYIHFKKFLKSNGFKVEVEAIPKGYDMGNVLFTRN